MSRSPLGYKPDLPGPALLGFIACAAMVRRAAFLAVGGFDEIVRFPGEEARVAIDLAAAGWGLAYVDDVVVHHHPSPQRDSPDRRQASIARSRLLTAAMRRPWKFVLHETLHHLTSGSIGRAGVVSAIPGLVPALRARRRTTRRIEMQLVQLQSNEQQIS